MTSLLDTNVAIHVRDGEPALHRSNSLYPMGPIIAAFQRK